MSNDPFISVNAPMLRGNEKKYLDECIDTGWLSSQGPFVRRLETEFATRCLRTHGVAVTSGTAALQLCFESLELEAGSEVIMPTCTIISCAAAIIRAGAVPVLVDSDPITWNMDIDQISSKISARTRAILAVHTYGLPVDLDPVLTLADRHNLRVIEDAAEMHGQTYKQKPCGSFGYASIFSLHASKPVTAGEGGLVLTNDETFADSVQWRSNLCFSEPRFVHQELGWNYRLSNLQAAVAVGQLETIDEAVEKKRAIGAYYNNSLAGLDLQLPMESTDYATNVYWVYGLVLGQSIKTDARQVMQEMAKLGIETRPFFWPMHQQPALLKRQLFAQESHPVAEHLAKRGLYLPTGVGLTIPELDRISSSFRSVLSRYTG